MADDKSKFWLDLVVDQIIEQHPSGEIIVESGISPSGSYHIGHFREAITTDVIAQTLRARGRKAIHIHFVDDSDPLRKLYPFLPKQFEQYVGWPYWMIPDPVGDCHQNYADHYFAEFKAIMDEAGTQMEVLISHEQYLKGYFDQQLDQAIAKADVSRSILNEVSNRALPADWTGVQVLEANTNFRNVAATEWDEVKKLIPKGKVKLAWRLDWPARWARVGVDVEPFGREHATKGGSYETGARLVKEVFGRPAPFPVPYDTINLVGETKKMSSSIGNLVSLADGLAIMPPEVLRYFIIRSRPDRKIYFDPGNIHNLIEEFTAAYTAINNKQSHPFAEACKTALGETSHKDLVISSAPFNSLVNSYQTAGGNYEKTLENMKRLGWQPLNGNERLVLKRELKYIKNWLDKYAPDEVKFAIQPKIPPVKLDYSQKQFLGDLAKAIETQKGELDAQWVHDTIYKLSEEHKVKPAAAFKAIYQVILGQDHGPKAGWFLASLDKNWLTQRLKLKS